MTKCDIQSWMVTPPNVPFNQSEHVAAMARTECKTHGWDMTDTHHLKGNEMCPIGKIEAATDHAINLINFHARQGK